MDYKPRKNFLLDKTQLIYYSWSSRSLGSASDDSTMSWKVPYLSSFWMKTMQISNKDKFQCFICLPLLAFNGCNL